jgi:hypothetical protein
MRSLGPIVLAKNHDGRLELVTKQSSEAGYDPYTVLHRWQETPGGEWTDWNSLGEPPGGSGGYGPAVARNSDGRLEIVLNGLDGAAWHRWQRREGGWSDWRSLGKPPELQTTVVAGYPTLVYNGDGRLELFTRGDDLAVWHIWQRSPSSGWSAWSSLKHPPDHPMVDGWPVVVRNKDWRLELFVAIDGVVWTRSQRPEGGWSDWESLGAPEGQEASWVVAAQTRQRTVNLFTGDSELFHRWQFFDGSGWGSWRPLPKPPRVRFATVGAHADGRLVLFGVEEDTGSLWKLEQDHTGSSWSEWQSIVENPVPGEQLETSTLALDAKGQLELWFLIENTRDLYRLKQATPNGTEWNGERFSNKEPV